MIKRMERKLRKNGNNNFEYKNTLYDKVILYI